MTQQGANDFSESQQQDANQAFSDIEERMSRMLAAQRGDMPNLTPERKVPEHDFLHGEHNGVILPRQMD